MLLYVICCYMSFVLQESTDGTFIEERESSLVWNYRDADPDFGSWQVSRERG